MSNKQEMLKMQTCVLRVNIQCHCDGCKKKIRKLLQKIDGVYSTQVNAEQGRVTVTGNVDPAKLIKTLEKSGKHAELWGPQKGSNNNYQNLLNNFKNMQMDVGKGGSGKDKSQKGGGKGQQNPQQMQFKGPGNMKMMIPNKLDQKSAKFSAPEDDFDGSNEEFDDDFEDDDEEFDDDYEDDDDEEFGGHGNHHGHNMPNKMMPMKGNNNGHMPPHGAFGMMNGPGFGGGHNMPNKMMPVKGNSGHMPHGPFGMMNGPGFGDKKGGVGGGGGGVGSVKKGGGGAIEIPVVMKGKGGKNDGKNGSGGKKGKSGQVKEGKEGKSGPGKGGKDKKKDGKDKSGGKSGGGGGLLGFLKRSKSGREIVSDEYDCDSNDNLLGGGGKSNGNGAKKGGGKGQGVHEINKMKKGFGEFDGHDGPRSISQMGQVGKMQMGQMGKMGPTGPMGSYGQAVQGLPGQHPMSGGYYQGMGPGNPYGQQMQQQQQYMAMMMNQQRQNGNDMYHPMMYARPHPAVNYMPPPMPPPPVADPLTHIFSDENTDSCSIM